MNGFAVAVVALAVVLALACAAACVQLARGAWLFLVAGAQARDFPSDEQERRAVTAGRRMAPVLGTLALLLATMAAYQGLRLAGSDAAQVFLMANNVMFVAFIIALVAFYVMQRAYKDPLDKPAAPGGRTVTSEQAALERRARKARLDAFPTATLATLIAVVVIAVGTGILFSLLP